MLENWKIKDWWKGTKNAGLFVLTYVCHFADVLQYCEIKVGQVYFLLIRLIAQFSLKTGTHWASCCQVITVIAFGAMSTAVFFLRHFRSHTPFNVVYLVSLSERGVKMDCIVLAFSSLWQEVGFASVLFLRYWCAPRAIELFFDSLDYWSMYQCSWSITLSASFLWRVWFEYHWRILYALRSSVGTSEGDTYSFSINLQKPLVTKDKQSFQAIWCTKSVGGSCLLRPYLEVKESDSFLYW